jgi:hypothetical protein
MIIKEELDQIIQSAKYKLAKQTIKYYTKLAVGQKCDKTFRKLRLMKYYIKLLEAFKIVGDVGKCECTVEGDYTFFADGSISETEVKIQFLPNNQAYIYYNNVGYPATYGYDVNNAVITVVTDSGITILFGDVEFNDVCSITHNGNFPIEIGETGTIGTPNPLLGGSIILFDEELDPIITFNYGTELTGDYEAIAAAWNLENSETGWVLTFVDGKFRMASPFDNTNYFGYSYTFYQSEGDYIDAIALFVEPFATPFKTTTTPATTNQVIPTTQFSGIVAQTNEFEISNAFLSVDETIITVYYLGNPITDKDAPITLPDFITYFNESNTQGFIMEAGPSGGNNVIVKAPAASDVYNGEAISFDNTVDIIFGTFTGGVNITPGNIIVTDEILGVIYFQNSSIFTTIQDFVDHFNLNNTGGFSAITNGTVLANTRVRYTAPVGTGFAYNGTSLEYSFFGTGYSDNSFWNSGEDTTTGNCTISLLSPLNVFETFLYLDNTLVNYANIEQLVDAFNNSTTNLGFVASTDGTSFQITAPENTGTLWNDWIIQFVYNYESNQYLDIEVTRPFLDGVDPTVVPYDAIFTPTPDTTTLINDNPCEDTINELVCLTNEQAQIIINELKSL